MDQHLEWLLIMPMEEHVQRLLKHLRQLSHILALDGGQLPAEVQKEQMQELYIHLPPQKIFMHNDQVQQELLVQ